MPDRVVLSKDDCQIVVRDRQVNLVVPYERGRAHLHRYAAEIAESLRATATAKDRVQALRALIVEFQPAHVELNVLGDEEALEFWLSSHRLVVELQDTINRVHDQHLPRPA